MKYDKIPRIDTKSNDPFKDMTKDERQAAFYNSTKGDLTDCPKCNGRGYFDVTLEGKAAGSIMCECLVKRNARMNLERSNAKQAVEKYTMDSFETEYPFQQRMKEVALKSLEEKKWFVVVGKSGTGKTHLCSALLSEWFHKGARVELLPWRQEANNLKRNNMNPDFEVLIGKYKKADVLMIDDFLKAVNPTDADIQLAMEIIDTRYANDLVTIINTEWSTRDIMEYDESLASRIVEKSEGINVNNGKNIRIEKRKSSEGGRK